MISSISSNSHDANLVWPRRQHWIVAIAVGLAFGGILLWTSARGSGGSELRVATGGSAPSALLIDGDQRILVLNSAGPQDARSVIGQLIQPWERDPSALIVSAEGNNEEAIWEALQRMAIKQMIVVGAPGSDPDWTTIERYCGDHDVELDYVGVRTTIQLTTIEMSIEPPNTESGSYLELTNGMVHVLIELSGRPEVGRFHVSVSGSAREGSVWSDIQIVSGAAPLSNRSSLIPLRGGDRIDLTIDRDRVRIRGRAGENLVVP